MEADRARSEAELRDIRGWVRRSPAWAVSLAAHFVLGVILMNIVYFQQHDGVSRVFRLTMGSPGGRHQGDQDNGVNGKHSEDSPPAETHTDRSAANSGPPMPGVARSSPLTSVSEKPAGIGVVGKPGPLGMVPGGIFSGRGGAGRGDRLKRYGGDGQTEKAVEDGLAWLARHQDSGGAWGTLASANRCPDGDSCSTIACKAPVGTTGLALLAFLGAGFTDSDCEYAKAVGLARDSLLRSQRPDGCFYDTTCPTMYSHAIATFALAELYALTQDPDLRRPVTRGVEIIQRSQQKCGGWDYFPEANSGRGDTSVTTWQVQALRSARLAGLPVRASTWNATRAYYEKMTITKNRSIYYDTQLGPQTSNCTGILACGALARNYLGVLPDQEFDAAIAHRILARDPWAGGTIPMDGNTYNEGFPLAFAYYGTLFLFHYGGEEWEGWNARMRKAVLGGQAKDGDDAGSWCPPSIEEDFCGRCGATAFFVMDLEIYYRYLPSYADERQAMAALVDGEDEAKTPEKADLKDASVKELLRDLGSAEMLTRRNAAKELSRRKEASATAALVDAAREEKTSLKPVLVEYLSPFVDDNAVADFLIQMLNQPDERVQSAALAALEKGSGQHFGADHDAWAGWRMTRKR